jgi:S1-C subfamily serine protease
MTVPGSSLACLALCLLLAPRSDLRAEEVDGAKVYRGALRGTVVVFREKATGTGWVVDRSRRHIITNYHVVGEHKVVKVVFPRFKQGQVVAEMQTYRKGPFQAARVIRVDQQHDLALLQVESLPEGTRELKLAAQDSSPGSRVHSIGTPFRSGALWVYTSGTVRSVYRKQWQIPMSDQKDPLKLSSRVVEVQSPVNPGDSGGPLLNDRGEVIGVVQGTNVTASLINYAIAASEVRAFLQRQSGNVTRGSKRERRMTARPAVRDDDQREVRSR